MAAWAPSLANGQVRRVAPGRQALMGLSLAALIVAAWLAIHLVAVYRLPLGSVPALLVAPVLVAIQCWLGVGLFIVAHDAMHGSLAPFRPRLNRAVGRVALLLYGGIWFDSLVERHFAHHRAPGTDGDPDFSGDGTAAPWRWFGDFFREYVSAWQITRMSLYGAAALWVFGAAPANLLLFWALPALLSSVQLFVFGTYLPHRREAADFADRHRARSNDYSYLLSLATCFHFGYHHEHHDDPSVPWWRLPRMRRGRPSGGHRTGVRP